MAVTGDLAGDVLMIRGGSFDTAVYDFSNANDGTIRLDGNLITYRGLEPIGTVARPPIWYSISRLEWTTPN